MAPLNTWLGAGTSLFQPYPCRCEEGRGWRDACSPKWCFCAGRVDVWNFAPECCAWVHTPAVAARAAADYAASIGR